MTNPNEEARAIAAPGLREAFVPAERQRNRTAASVTDQEDDGVAIEGFKPLLPEGKWLEARFDGHATATIFGAQKVFWEFTVTEPGEDFEKKLFRAFRVRKVIGRPGKNGKFVLAAGGEMYQTLVRLLDVKLRKDRISLRPLQTMLFRVRTRTVKVNHKQEPLADHAQYSVIDAIERGE